MMTPRTTVALLIGLTIAAVTGVAVLVVPISVRHAAPFGSVQTVDFNRSIAVLGGEIRPNYGDFDRVELDLRAYGDRVPEDQYDFVLTLQSLDRPDVVRRVEFSVPRDRIAASRSAFADNYTSVRFDRIADSAGETFYLTIERGPRNADDVVTLWGIQSFSTVKTIDVLRAAANGYPIGLDLGADRALLVLLMGLTLAGGAALVGTIVAVSLRDGERRTAGSIRALDGS